MATLAVRAKFRYNGAMNEERLIKIETTLMHQGEQIQDLEEALTLQRKDMDRLSRLLERAHAQIAEMETAQITEKSLSVSEQAARDKPPHY